MSPQQVDQSPVRNLNIKQEDLTHKEKIPRQVDQHQLEMQTSNREIWPKEKISYEKLSLTGRIIWLIA